MTKNNLIDHVTEATKGSRKETQLVIDALLATIIETLAKGEKVDLRGFGSFQVSGKKERQGRNPRTGETVTIAARNVAVFKPSKECKVLKKYTATRSTCSHPACFEELASSLRH